MELWVQKKNCMKTCSEKHSKTRKALCIFLDVTENALASSMPFNDTLGWMETQACVCFDSLFKRHIPLLYQASLQVTSSRLVSWRQISLEASNVPGRNFNKRMPLELFNKDKGSVFFFYPFSFFFTYQDRRGNFKHPSSDEAPGGCCLNNVPGDWRRGKLRSECDLTSCRVESLAAPSPEWNIHLWWLVTGPGNPK